MEVIFKSPAGCIFYLPGGWQKHIVFHLKIIYSLIWCRKHNLFIIYTIKTLFKKIINRLILEFEIVHFKNRLEFNRINAEFILNLVQLNCWVWKWNVFQPMHICFEGVDLCLSIVGASLHCVNNPPPPKVRHGFIMLTYLRNVTASRRWRQVACETVSNAVTSSRHEWFKVLRFKVWRHWQKGVGN